MDHEKRAQDLFREGYNCSQAVVCAFTDLTGLDIQTSARLASSFGGGMGRLREVCGAVSGVYMVLGILQGYSDPDDHDGKIDQYHIVQEIARRFKELNGSIVCRDLMKDILAKPGNEPEERTPEFYASRPCLRVIGQAARILDDILEEQKEKA